MCLTLPTLNIYPPNESLLLSLCLPPQGMSNNQVLEHVRSGHTISLPKSVKPQL